MPVYLGAMFISLALCVGVGLTPSSKRTPGRYLKWFPILPFLLVSMLRYGIGVDYLNIYVPLFETISFGFSSTLGMAINSDWIEPGFYLLNFVVSRLSHDSFWVFAVMAAVFHWFIWKFILDHPVNVPLSIVLFFVTNLFMWSMGGIRQAAAIAICLYALKYISMRAWRQYFFFVLIASSFHATALLFLVGYFLLNRTYSSRAFVFLAAICAGALLAGDQLAAVVSTILPKYASYFGSAWDKGRTYWSLVFVFSIVALFLFPCRKRVWDSYKDGAVLFNLFIFGLVLSLLSSLIPNAERLVIYEEASILVLLPMLVRQIGARGTLRTTSGVGLLVGALVVCMYLFRTLYDYYVISNSHGLAEYLSIIPRWFG